MNLTEDTVQNLLSAANLFQLIPLRDGCAEFMMNHVTVANCIGVFFFAKAHQCNVLALKAKEIINNKVSECVVMFMYMLCGYVSVWMGVRYVWYVCFWVHGSV